MLKTIKESDPRITGEAWKTQDRKAVEVVLHGARVMGDAMTPQRIASLAGVELKSARSIIQSLMTAKQIANTGTSQQPKYRMRGEAATNYIPTKITNGNSRGSYQQHYPIWRPGATDHETLPSRMGKKLIFRDGTVADAV